MTRLATGWAIFQGLLIEALPFLLLGVTIAGLARWLVPQSTWVRRLPRHPLLAPLVGALWVLRCRPVNAATFPWHDVF